MRPGKYHQNGGFSRAMLLSGRVVSTTYSAAQRTYFRWLLRERSPNTILQSMGQFPKLHL